MCMLGVGAVTYSYKYQDSQYSTTSLVWYGTCTPDPNTKSSYQRGSDGRTASAHDWLSTCAARRVYAERLETEPTRTEYPIHMCGHHEDAADRAAKYKAAPAAQE